MQEKASALYYIYWHHIIYVTHYYNTVFDLYGVYGFLCDNIWQKFICAISIQ